MHRAERILRSGDFGKFISESLWIARPRAKLGGTHKTQIIHESLITISTQVFLSSTLVPVSTPTQMKCENVTRFGRAVFNPLFQPAQIIKPRTKSKKITDLSRSVLARARARHATPPPPRETSNCAACWAVCSLASTAARIPAPLHSRMRALWAEDLEGHWGDELGGID